MSVTDGWNSCANRFISIVRDEMARPNPRHEERILELCWCVRWKRGVKGTCFQHREVLKVLAE